VSLRSLYLTLPAGARVGSAVVSYVLRQGRRAPRAAPRSRRASPRPPATAPGLGGPGRVRRARVQRWPRGCVAIAWSPVTHYPLPCGVPELGAWSL